MNETELRNAQKSLYNGSKLISDAGMRLEGTKYEKDYLRLWRELVDLNTRLIRDIHK